MAFGVLRGAGRNTVAALLTGTSYWAIGIPIAIALSYLTPLKLAGLWTGTTIALALTAAFCSLYIWHLNFAAECRKALARAAQEDDGFKRGSTDDREAQGGFGRV